MYVNCICHHITNLYFTPHCLHNNVQQYGFASDHSKMIDYLYLFNVSIGTDYLIMDNHYIMNISVFCIVKKIFYIFLQKKKINTKRDKYKSYNYYCSAYIWTWWHKVLCKFYRWQPNIRWHLYTEPPILGLVWDSICSPNYRCIEQIMTFFRMRTINLNFGQNMLSQKWWERVLLVPVPMTKSLLK